MKFDFTEEQLMVRDTARDFAVRELDPIAKKLDLDCTFPADKIKMLAEMGTKIEASKLLLYSAAEKKDRGERCDLEAGMAKLFATETAQEASLQAMRIHGGAGYSKDFRVERYYRDAPLLIIGGGTSELQRLIIAKGLLAKYPVK